ncbi:hypothetical protein [Streptomyces sp. NPDC001153]
MTAHARCLRSYTRTSGCGGHSSVTTTLHHVYEFITQDGRVIRFDEANGPSAVGEDVSYGAALDLSEQPCRVPIVPYAL